MEVHSGFEHFFQALDGVGKAIFVLLLLMSIASWYLMIAKGIELYLGQSRAKKFLALFGNMHSTLSNQQWNALTHIHHAYAEVTASAINAKQHQEKHPADVESNKEFLMRHMRKAIDQQATVQEKGLTMLASIASSAPYVGLLGTVWGVYHALINIGLNGNDTLDKVSGPVGEALIMTAFGLSVAIPAVLAYNFFTRTNRLHASELDSFAHDLFTLLTTGSVLRQHERANKAGNVVTLKAPQEAV